MANNCEPAANMNTPQAISRSRTDYVNVPGTEGQLLEWRNNAVLYSSVMFDAAALPSELVAFNYSVGQNVTTSGTQTIKATNWHTNLRQPKTLPAPEVFVVDRVRLWAPPLYARGSGANYEPTIDNPSSGTTVTTLNNPNDQQALLGLHVRFEIEGKRYIDAPYYMLPGNTGVSGISASSMTAGTTAASATLQVRRNVAVNWAGEGWRFSDSLPPIITSTTLMDFRYLGQHNTNPSIGLSRYVWAILQGTHGRAVR